MLDTPHLWDRPLTIALDGQTRIVSGPAEARRILLLEWPADPTDKHKAASDTCLDAMEGAAAEPSWVAFMEVAIEAGIFVE